MWLIMTLRAVFTTSLLLCTCSAYSSYAEFEPSNPGQYSTSRKESSDPRWNLLEDERSNYLFGTDIQRDGHSNFLNLNSWPEKISLSRQLFGDKTAESFENHRSEESDDEDISKSKRESHSLSIVNPLDVLRQRLMLEMARRRMKANQDQIEENAVILKNLGKRAVSRANHENSGGHSAAETRTNQDYLRRIHVSNSEDFDI